MDVVLRPLTAADHDALFDWMRDPAAVAQAAFTAPDPGDRARFDGWLERVAALPTARTYAVDVDGRFAANVGAWDSEDGREVAYWVDPARWGQGVATAAVRLLLDVEPRRPLLARVAEHNIGSAKVLQRNGFRAIGSAVGFAEGLGREVAETLYRLDG